MLSLPATVRIWLCAQPTDLRKSFDSLASIVRDALGGDPLSGNIFVFRNKAADRIKLLVWEEDGYAIWGGYPVSVHHSCQKMNRHRITRDTGLRGRMN